MDIVVGSRIFKPSHSRPQRGNPSAAQRCGLTLRASVQALRQVCHARRPEIYARRNPCDAGRHAAPPRKTGQRREILPMMRSELTDTTERMTKLWWWRSTSSYERLKHMFNSDCESRCMFCSARQVNMRPLKSRKSGNL